MIKIPTVLILGAGASIQFGFPSGLTLLKNITGWPTTPRNPIGGEFGFDDKLVDEFKFALHNSGHSSVDAFVEHRPTFLEVGKAAIARELILCERPNVLLDHSHGASANWYRHLLDKMVGSFEDFAKNKLTVVTFNYDRSFEQFLFVALLNRFGRDQVETANAIAHLPIIHVHGQLGDLPWKSRPTGDVRPYADELTPETLRIASRGIKIIHENIDNTPEFEKARQSIERAERVFFFGFGYHPKNLQRLGFVRGREAGNGVSPVWGTWQGMTREEHAVIQRIYPVCKFDRMIHEAADIMGLMRHTKEFLNVTE